MTEFKCEHCNWNADYVVMVAPAKEFSKFENWCLACVLLESEGQLLHRKADRIIDSDKNK